MITDPGRSMTSSARLTEMGDTNPVTAPLSSGRARLVRESLPRGAKLWCGRLTQEVFASRAI